MPWSQTSPMDQKTQFIADYLRRSLSVTELCEHYDISRKTGYKWTLQLHKVPCGSSRKDVEDWVAASLWRCAGHHHR
jgi:putative transposase